MSTTLTHAGLPEACSKTDVIAVLEGLGKCSMAISITAFRVLRHYAWRANATDYQVGRICAVWEKVGRTADTLGLSVRAINMAERELEAKGLIRRTTGGNGARSGLRMAGRIKWAAGVNLAPLIERYAELSARREGRRLHQEAVNQCKAEIRHLRNTIRRSSEADSASSGEAVLPNGRVARIGSMLGAERIIMAGDTRQLLAVEAGKPFEVTQERGAPTSHITQNLRAASLLMKAVNAALVGDDVAGAFKVLENQTVEVGRHEASQVAAGRWASLPKEERDSTVLLAASRSMRSATNAAVQQELKGTGELGAQARSLTVLERVSVTREGARQMRAYQDGRVVEFSTNLPSQDFARGERGVVIGREGNTVSLHLGDGLLKDLEPGRLAKNLGHDAVSIFQEKQLLLHEGDRIRWTTNDAERGLLNNQQAEVRSITGDTVTVRTADGALHELKEGDRMLERLDLAYALTVHAAQGMTAQSDILVMREEERQLNSTRSFLVAATRVTDNLTLVVDNAQSVERSVSRNPGDKTSALDIAQSAAAEPHPGLPERSLERSL